jgi:hypothetical protein
MGIDLVDRESGMTLELVTQGQLDARLRSLDDLEGLIDQQAARIDELEARLARFDELASRFWGATSAQVELPA